MIYLFLSIYFVSFLCAILFSIQDWKEFGIALSPFVILAILCPLFNTICVIVHTCNINKFWIDIDWNNITYKLFGRRYNE